MIVQESSSVVGKWIDKKMLKSGDIAKIKSEATEQPSQQGGTQLVAKLLIKGQIDPANVAINKPSKNALIKAFGNDTKDWMDKELTLQVETAIVSGKRGIALYMIPNGYELKEDAGGYLVIVKKGVEVESTYPESTVNIDDIPF